MKKFIPLIADALLAGVCVFLLFFTLVRYYFSTAAGLAAGITAGLAAGAGTFFYIRAKQKKTLELSACKAGAEKLAVHLSLTGNHEAAALIAACTGGKPAGSFAESDDKLFYACFTPEPATRNELIPLIRAESAKQKVFACCTATPACADFAAATNIEIMGADGVYELFERAEKLPEKYLWEGKKRTKFLTLVRSRFTKRLCLPTFWSGAALLFFSYFTYYPIYYITVGSLLLALCAAAAIFGKKKGA